MALISIIVPVYNVEKYIRRCIESILLQTFSDFELLLIDDGSLDNCGVICDTYATKDKRIVVMHKENGGVSSARNVGIERAFRSDTEWVCFVDSDDWLHPQALELLYNAATNHHSKISVCEYQSKSEYQPIPTIPETSVTLWNTEDLYVSLTVNAIAPWAKLFHKSLFETIRFPLGVRFEDERTIYKALFQVNSIPYVNCPLYFYFSNPTGFMNTRDLSVQMAAIPAFEEPLLFFEEYGYTKAFNARINVYFHALTKMIRSVSLLSYDGFSTKAMLHKKRIQIFKWMNSAQRARVCNELHPHLMGIYWYIYAGVRMVFRGEGKKLFRKVKAKIRK